MADPPRPAPTTLVDSDWGGWVHDRAAGARVQLYVQSAANFTLATNGAFTVIPFPAPLIDTGSCWQAASNAWRAPRDGLIDVTAMLRLTTTITVGTGNYGAAIYKNAAEYRFLQTTGSNTSYAGGSGAMTIPVVAGDLITLQAYVNDSGSAGTTRQAVHIYQMAIRWAD